MLSKLTLIGLHNYSKGAIWGDIDDYIPVGVNKEVLINEILKEDGEFSVIYPDPEFLRVQIKMFFMKYQQMFTKWINVLNEEYDPLFNVDVKTSNTEHGVNEEESASSGLTAGTRSSNGSGSSSGNSGNTHTKAAYDASTLQATEGDSGSTSLSTSENASESSSSSNSESMTASSEHTITREDWKRGNYGTTMSQELLLAEFNARRFNIYNQIADLFAGEFCITLYV